MTRRIPSFVIFLALTALVIWSPLPAFSQDQVGPGQIDKLIEQLGDDDIEIRDQAQAQLEKIGKPAVEALEKVTKDEDPERRARAQDILDRLRNVARKTETEKDKFGNPVKETDFNALGEKLKETAFGPDGKPVKTTEYKNGKPVKVTEYHPNGKPKKVTEYKDGKPVKIAEYDKEGRPKPVVTASSRPAPKAVTAITETAETHQILVLKADPGTVKLYVPPKNHMAANTRFTGKVELEPKGKTESERQNNLARLQGYVVVDSLEGKEKATPVSGGFLTGTIAAVLAGGAAALLLKDQANNVVDIGHLPIATTPPTLPPNFLPPKYGQVGGALSIPGPFDGNGDATVRIGGVTGERLVEYKGGLVVGNTSDIIGKTKIEVTENDSVVAEGDFRNCAVGIHADKNKLKPGEKMEMNFTAELGRDFAASNEEVALEVKNETPTVVRVDLRDGDDFDPVIIPHGYQFTVEPEDVDRTGVCQIPFMVTGNHLGVFGITAGIAGGRRGDDPWHVAKGLIETAEEFNKWIDDVKKDLEAHKAKLGNKGSEKNLRDAIDGILQNIDVCKMQEDLEKKKLCADLLLNKIEVIKTGAALWVAGFDLYKAAIQAIVAGKVDWDLLFKALDWVKAQAKATGDNELKKKIEKAKKIAEKVKEGKEALDKLQDALEKIQEELNNKVQ